MASVSVTVASLIDGEPLNVTVSSLPEAGVFFTSNALFARFAAAARFSLKVITSDAPSTAAELTAGAVVSTVKVAVRRDPLLPAASKCSALTAT